MDVTKRGRASLNEFLAAIDSLSLCGNNVNINTSQASAYINVDNNGANTGNAMVMGQLDYTGFVATNPAPSICSCT